ncbi:MAG: tRNA adenosine(34) deaminase TadA [Candidatus Neomarinimicrobiota bacterium]
MINHENTSSDRHEYWMKQALRLAEIASENNEIPVGALIISNENIVGKGFNQTETLLDPTAHAEILAITAAANTLQDWRLDGCTLYVTKEPCAMCAGAINNARLTQVVFGCYDGEEGCCGSLYSLCGDPHLGSKVAVLGGVLADSCGQLLQSFFKSRRKT